MSSSLVSGDGTVLSWHIRILDQRLRNEFPLPTRNLYLDWGALPQDLTQLARELIGPGPPQSHDAQVGDVEVTMSRGGRHFDPRWFALRPYFREATPAETPVWEIFKLSIRRFDTVPADLDYIEDETSRRVSMIDVIENVSGQSGIVLFDHPESVTRRGPSPMIDPTSWTDDDATLLTHFLDVSRLISTSTWFDAPATVTVKRQHGASGVARASSLPTAEQTLAVLALIRQLFSKDRLFDRACETYSTHTSCETRKMWVGHYRGVFQGLCGGTVWPAGPQCTRAELFEALLYGAGIMHVGPRDLDVQNRLLRLLKDHGREVVMMAFHMSLTEIMSPVLNVRAVVAQDVASWLKAGAARSPRPTISELFGHQTPRSRDDPRLGP